MIVAAGIKNHITSFFLENEPTMSVKGYKYRIVRRLDMGKDA